MLKVFFYLLELQQEGALVLAPAVLLHSLLDELVEDGGDGLGADPLQQLQLGATTAGNIKKNIKKKKTCHWRNVKTGMIRSGNKSARWLVESLDGKIWRDIL